MDLSGVFPSPMLVKCAGDIHSDMQLLYTLLVDVMAVIRPVTHTATVCACGFRPKFDSAVRSPDRLLDIRDILPSCTFEWCADPGTWVVFLGDLTDRRRGEDTLKFETQKAQQSMFDGEMRREEECIFDFINFAALLAVKSKELVGNKPSRVLKLLGNHELMNLDPEQANEEYVTPQAMYDTSSHLGFAPGLAGRKQAFGFMGADMGPLRRKLMCMGLYALVQIGPALFMHGGLCENLTKHPHLKQWFPPIQTLVQLHQQNPYLAVWNVHHSHIPFINSALWKWLNTCEVVDQDIGPGLNTTPIHDPDVSQALFKHTSTLFWNRDWSQENMVAPNSKKWSRALHQSIGAFVHPQRSILVVGHCVQNERLSEQKNTPTYKFILQTHSVADMVYKLGKKAWHCNKNNLSTYSGQIKSSGAPAATMCSLPWSGVQFQNPMPEQKGATLSPPPPIQSAGRIYMCDCAMSRAFDMDHEKKMFCSGSEHDSLQKSSFHCRAPQCLVFRCQDKWAPEVCISKFHLSRRWLFENKVEI